VDDGMQGLAFDRAGNLYAANYLDNTVIKFTPDGVRSVFASASTGLNGPMGLAFDSVGNLYVSNYRGNNIVKLSPAGTSSVFNRSGLSGPDGLDGLACDSADNIYVANLTSGTVLKFTPDGFIVVRYSFSTPEGLALDSEGNLYVADYSQNSITKISPDGTGSIFANSGLNKPSFIAVIPESPASVLFGLGICVLFTFRSQSAVRKERSKMH